MDDSLHTGIPQRLSRAVAWFAGYRGIPYLSRHSFRFEFRAVMLFSIAAAAIEPGFLQLFAKKMLDAPDWAVAVLAAAHVVGMLTGGLTAAVLTRRRQVPVLTGCLLLTGGLLASAALLPPHAWAALLFAAVVMLVATLNATVTNAKASILQANYPAAHRGQVFSRLILVGTILMATLVQVNGIVLDHWGGYYRVLFVLAGLSAAATGITYARVRMRGEQARLRRQTVKPASMNPLRVFDVLRRDRLFARYMGWQMLLGSANHLLETGVLAIILAERFGAGFASGAMALVVVPMVIRIATIPVLGRLFDQMNFMKFRGIGAVIWGVSRLVLFVGVWQVSMPILVLGRCLTGLSSGFGGFGWSLGHLKFAREGEGPLYMGVHMLLTGVRGCTMPFLAILLYRQLGVGIHLIWITGLMHLISAWGLWRMHDQMPQAAAPDAARPEPVETRP